VNDDSAKLPRRPTINGAGVLVLGGAAFVLSYDTLYRLALRIGFPGRLAWLWPLIIDGFIVYASDEALHRARTGKRWQAAYAWLLVLCATAGSAAFQVATAPPTILSRIGHAVPPVALLLAFEIRRRRVAEHVAAVPAEAAPGLVDAARVEVAPDHPGVLDRPHPPTSSGTRTGARPRRKPTPPDTDAYQRARRIYEEAAAAGRKLTGAELAAAIGTSARYGRVLLAKLREVQAVAGQGGEAR
jgi:hypothetical protein